MSRKKYIILVLIFGLVLALSFCFKINTSTTTAHYRSDLDATSTARVAKWDIRSVTKKKGESIQLDAGFSDTIIDGSGNWFFEMENASDVKAAINKTSTIKLRLDAETLNTKEDALGFLSWDFLGTNNPVNFAIYMYNTSAESMISYQKGTTTIPYHEFSGVADKTGYEEVITVPDGVTKTLILDTASDGFNDNFKFQRKIELVDAKEVIYYELVISLDSIFDQNISLGLGDTKTNYSFQVHWEVSSTSSTGEKIEENSKEYIAYAYKEGTISPNTFIVNGKEFNTNYTLNDINYYVEQTNKDIFEYLKYTSSLGGEPQFEFVTTSATGKNQLIKVRYSNLTEAQRNTIKSYANNSIETLDDLKHLIEYCQYTQYETFQIDMASFMESLSYLSMGLECKITFNILVEQVD